MRRLLFLLLLVSFSAQAAYKGDLRADTAATVSVCLVNSSTALPETDEDIDQADVRVKKNGGNFAQKNDATNNAPHDENGCYDISIDATDTNTEGRLEICVDEADTLNQCDTYTVLASDFYDVRYNDGELLTGADVGLIFEDPIATVTNQSTYDMTATIVSDDNWNENEVSIEDVSTGEIFSTWVSDVDQANDRISVNDAPPFTVVAADVVRVYSNVHPEASAGAYGTATLTNVNAARDSVLSDLLCYFQLALRSDTAIKADQASCLSSINADEGTGAGDYDNVASSAEASDPFDYRNLIIEDQGSVTLGCAMAVILSYAAGDWSGTTSVTYQPATAGETRIVHDVSTANQRGGTITCPTY